MITQIKQMAIIIYTPHTHSHCFELTGILGRLKQSYRTGMKQYEKLLNETTLKNIAKLSPNFSFSWADMDFNLNFFTQPPTPE